ncbi:phosphate ABC transporter permease subunit PstC [Wukongibacter sp. M2B1]|uniref:phosphate ABC transporter permease subunit PstC n=1 Tax=Wukongibacter sp. M2B1 TaxID=3088895 RepID=UPI003D7965E1
MSKKIHMTLDGVFGIVVKGVSLLVVMLLGFIIIFVLKEAFLVFKEVPFYQFVFTKGWKPTSQPIKLGILPMILASIYVSLLAILFSLPIGLGTSIFLSFVVNKRLKRIIRIIVDLMAGIPSVIYGFFGLVVIVKFFEVKFDFTSGETVLSASILLSIMILPYIVSTCEESIEKVRNNYQSMSKALGVSKWYMIRHLILPSAKRAVISALILALSRALGETMAIMMVIGNSPIYPKLLGKAQTIPALIALEMGGAQIDSMHYHGLFAAGFILMLTLLIINTIFYYIRKNYIDIY